MRIAGLSPWPFLIVASACCWAVAFASDSTIEEKQTRPKLIGTAEILKADSSGWLSHGRTYSEQRYSPLTKITVDNVSKLGLQWSFDLQTSRGIEATPIVHDGIIYVTSTWNMVYALDARSGKEIWHFDPKVDKKQAAKGCCDAVNRGLAFWGDSVFMGSIDGRLISLNAKTGKKNWDVSTIDKTYPYTITGAPRIINGLVMIGNGGAELGVRGYLSAYNAYTGEQVWRFYTVPGDPNKGFENRALEMAAKTWNGKYWQAGGGGTVWDSMAYDPDLELLYVGVGNGSPWDRELRSPGGGDNLFLSSIVALKPATGEYVWHYQTTPGDSWDYTATQHMILADLVIDGTARKVIMQAPKNGFFYVLDRITGEFISASNFVPVNWAKEIDPKTGRPVETKNARYHGKSPQPQLPGSLGAHNWQPMSYNPNTGLVYIPALEAPWIYHADSEYKYQNKGWNTGTDHTIAMLPNSSAVIKAIKSSLKGRLIAWDPIQQKEAWSVEHAGPWNGGTLTTAGNLVFQGTANAHFAAYDARTGKQKWRFFTQTGVMAAPITYALDGEQYIAVATGWGGAYGLGFGGVMPTGSPMNAGRLLVFKAAGEQTLPAVDKKQHGIEIPKLLDVNHKIIMQGKSAYANNCMVCHGDMAFSSGLTPNLRYSKITTNPEGWRVITLDGALAEQGMPGFSGIIDSATTEAIRAYVIQQANSRFDHEFYNSID